jgi:NAD(P)-dependent dehydrogenase (short-subunit alcohol dehydrogenase family)
MSFGAQSTTDDVLGGTDLSGRTVLVTGASAGLGVETARALASKGARVIGAVRDLAKGEHATRVVREAAAAGGSLSLVELDLASFASVRRCADTLVSARKPLDVIIANAGVMACPRGTTVDGFETQFGTNHLGHFLFVNRLVRLLRPASRVVVLSSAGHRFADVDLDDPGFERTEYQPFVAYGRSKTANVLFAAGLDRRLVSRGVRAVAVHPGGIQTELGRHLTPELIAQIMPPSRGGAAGFKFKTIAQGAATQVWCAVVAEADTIGGRYCEDCHVAAVTDDPESRTGVRAYALDTSRADALWTKSEQLVGERFDFS